jgi:hypothetical protein
MLLWFAVPLLGFTMFAGHVTDYYYLMNLPIVIFIVVIIVVIGIFYFFTNTKPYWQKPDDGGLNKQEEVVRQKIKDGVTFDYVEGDIESYLYTIWEIDKK